MFIGDGSKNFIHFTSKSKETTSYIIQLHFPNFRMSNFIWLGQMGHYLCSVVLSLSPLTAVSVTQCVCRLYLRISREADQTQVYGQSCRYTLGESRKTSQQHLSLLFRHLVTLCRLMDSRGCRYLVGQFTGVKYQDRKDRMLHIFPLLPWHWICHPGNHPPTHQ